MKLLYLIPFLLILSNCTTTKETVPPAPNVVKVYVPVAKPTPKPPVLHRPELAINKLSEEDKQDNNKVAKSAVITVNQLIMYSNNLEKYLNVYR